MFLVGHKKEVILFSTAAICILSAATFVPGAPNPPVSETFDAATLPSGPFWSFVSDGDGRIMALGDTSAATTNDAVPAPGTFSSAVSTGQFRGNIYFCTNDTFITLHEFYLGRTGDVSLVFAVYDSTSSNGLFTRVSSKTASATTGTNFVSSGAVNIPISAGKYYLIGAAWQESAQFYWRTNGNPVEVSFGTSIDSAVSNIYPAPLLVTNATASLSAYRQRITTTREGVARMDDAVADAANSTNAATLTVNLENYASAWLTFRHREPLGDDESHPDDGVFLSTNGVDFFLIAGIDESDASWHDYTVNLAAVAASNGVALSDNTRIRFGQYDNEPWPGDGREFDDILVFSAPDLYNSSVYPADSPIFTFKGTNSAKAIPLVSEIYALGGTNAVVGQQISLQYLLRYAGSNVYTEATNWWVDIPPLAATLNTLTNTLSVPPAVRLSRYNYTIRSVVDSTNGLIEGNELNNTTTQGMFVNHYSGRLVFDNVVTDITVTNWSVRGNPDVEHTISGYGDLNGYAFTFAGIDVLKDLSTLDYRLDPAATNTLHVDAVTPDTVGNIDYVRPAGVTLTTSGAWATVRMTLPAGLGWSTSAVSRVLSPYLVFPLCKLTQGLYPLPVTYVGTLFFYEEAKPLGIEASNVTWEPETGRLTLTPVSVSYVRESEIAALLSAKSLLADPSMAMKRSNEQFYQYVFSVSGVPVFRANPDGATEMTIAVGLTAGTNVAHFPYDAHAEWRGSGSVSITNDFLDPVASHLDQPTNVVVWYARDCPTTNCSANAGPAYLDFHVQSAQLGFSIDGGIVAVGTITPTNLTWGAITNAGYAQMTSPFTNSTYVVAGHFLRGTESVLGTTADYGPGELLLSGVLTNAPWSMERPETTAYDDGEGDYAGMNFRVLTDSAKWAVSTLGGTVTPQWPLDGESKYYARASGISGIHQAVAGQFPATLVIYGYTNNFTYYGLSYLSSQPYESLVEGSIFVPYPSDFTQEYEELMFTCLGDLTEAKVPTGGTGKTLSYWQSDFTPYTIRFAEQIGATCANNDRFLAIGVKTSCANVSQPLYGELGFLPGGNLIPEDAGVEGVDSRLRVNNNIELDGPGDEVYTFVPVGEAYHNNFDGETNGLTGVGFISFAGTVDVPFFEDLKVQFHTSANTNSTSAAIYMVGGWPTEGKGWTNSAGFDFFTTDSFDTHNSAFPTGDVTLAQYRDGTDDTYKVRARKTWLDVIDFDYPLDWSWVSRSFTSCEPTTHDFMVLAVEHQVDYMSAGSVEISFGVQYDGLPQINLVNMAFNSIDEATGMSEAFVNAIGSNVWKTVLNGLGDLDDILSDVPEPLFDAVLDATVDPVIDELYDEMEAAFLAGTNDLSAIIDAYVAGIGASAPATNVSAMLSDIVDGINGATTLIDDIDASLDRVVYLIDAFTTNVSIDPYTGNPLGSPDPGIIATSDDYSVLRDLAAGILGELAGDLADAIGSELESRLRTAISERAPSLEVITETLGELKTAITNLQAKLETGQDFLQELSDSIDTNIVQTAAEDAADHVKEWLGSLAESGSSLEEYTSAEIKALIRQKIEDEFYGTEVVADMQRILRERLYDLDSAIRESTDTVFQQLNQALRGVASEYLSSVDDSINGMLGDVGDTIGSGQIDGYAHIDQDSLKELRLDGKFQWESPDAMEFQGYIQLKQLDSDGEAGCGGGSGSANEVSLGAIDMGLGWMGSDLRATIGTKFTFETSPSFKVVGMGGSFEMTDGEIGFESFAITELAAAVAFGAYENYLSACVRAAFDDYQVEGGVFFGRTCTLDPILLWDPLVASILGDPPFTGIYVYGEGWMPIYNYGCLFTVSAGVGAGFFYFVDGPIGGKLLIGAEGEALCAVNVRGEVVLAGSKNGDSLRLAGYGTISGSAGVCPVCVEFSKTVEFGYDNGSWSVDY